MGGQVSGSFVGGVNRTGDLEDFSRALHYLAWIPKSLFSLARKRIILFMQQNYLTGHKSPGTPIFKFWSSALSLSLSAYIIC